MRLRLLAAFAALAGAIGTRAQPVSIFDEVVADGRFAPPAENRPAYVPAADLDAVFFFKNNEYFAPGAEGYTLVGYQVRPTLTWGRGPLALTAGLQALQYGGMEKMRYVRPFAAVRWQAAGWLYVQMGCLPGPASHQLHEAVQDPELQLTERPELGLQLSVRRPRLSAEGWVNWRKFIFMGDTVPERFTAGLKALLHPADTRAFSFQMPASLVFEHVGGQVSDYEEPMQSLANLSFAPSVVFRADSGGFVSRVSLAVNVLAFHTMAGADVRPFADGWALCPEVSLVARHLEASAGYFHGRDYYAMRGNPLFWSISNYDAGYYEQDRYLLTLSASYVTRISSWGRFSLDVKGYHDISDSRFDYSYGLTMVLTPSLGRAKGPRQL